MDAKLIITARWTERDVGARRAFFRSFIVLTGTGIAAEAEIDEDGAVADLTGEFPTALRSALIDVAECAEVWAHQPVNRRVTAWRLADGGVELVDDTAEAA